MSVLGALAIELRPGQHAGQAALAPSAAGRLAACVARDLAGFAPGVEALDLALVAALYDPVELLRPHWPLHGELERLVSQAPGTGPRVVGFGADGGHLPPPLQPDPAHGAGPLRLLPWLLRGDPVRAAQISQRFEDDLLEHGMAAADTALLAQEAFSAPVEHARYLTVHDLAAMMALQYEHAGLAPAWPLVETALLASAQECWLDAAPEPLARYADGEVRMAMLDVEAWVEGGFAPQGLDGERLSRAFDRFQARQRQLAAVFAAHGLAVTFDHCPAGRDPRAVLRA